MKKPVESKQYNRLTFLNSLGKVIKVKKGSFTTLGVAIPRNRKDLDKVWKPVLKATLRVMKRRFNLEYILVFEESNKGYQHAHVVIFSKDSGKMNFRKISRNDLQEIRHQFMRRLCLAVFKKSRNFGNNRTMEEFAHNLKLDPARVVHLFKGFKGKKQEFIPAGHGVGFLNYLKIKPEIFSQKTTLSAGVLALRQKSVDRLHPKGWVKKTLQKPRKRSKI